MKDLGSPWNDAKAQFYKIEKSLIGCLIVFLKEVANIYLDKNRKVFFRENRTVHWGEWNFGTLIIEGDEEVYDVFGEYISEIHFEPEIGEEAIKGYIEIKGENLEDIRYQINKI